MDRQKIFLAGRQADRETGRQAGNLLADKQTD